MDTRMEEYFGKPISTYTSNQAVDDGILMENPKTDKFAECTLMTTNLMSKIEEIACSRNLKRVIEIEPLELVGCLMLCAERIYSTKDFKGDNDRNFFVTPETDEGVIIWFVRNEYGKLTAMLPGDY